MADVFISYKSERRNAAQHLAKTLRLHGYDVWYDYGLLSGADFSSQIERQIRAAASVIVLWCDLSKGSPWVLEEASLGLSLQRLVPTWIERVELPLGFSRLDTIDLTTWDGGPRAGSLDKLLDQIARLTGKVCQRNADGLRDYEDDWRCFGSLPLVRLPLIAPLEDRQTRTSLSGAPPSLPPSNTAGDSFAVAWDALKSTTNVGRLKSFILSAAGNPLALAAEQRVEELEIATPARTALGATPKQDWERARLAKICADVVGASSTASLRALASQGDAQAQAVLAAGYARGIAGLTEDRAEAVRLYRASADQGNSFGQAGLSVMYYLGRAGLDVDFQAAVRLAKLSATAGNSWGQIILARCYYSGHGVEINKSEHMKLLQLSAKQGNPIAVYDLGMAYLEGDSVGVDTLKGKALLSNAALQGFAAAQVSLAKLYETGDMGVAKDLSEASRLYALAAAQGHEEAKEWLSQEDGG